MGFLDWVRTIKLKARELTHALEGEPVARLAAAHSRRELVLVLGAGASASYGLPTWNSLLQGLLLSVRLQGDDGSAATERRDLAELFNEVFTPGPLIAARYLRNAIDGQPGAAARTGLEKKVRELLYAEPPPDDYDSALMKEIRKLGAAPGDTPTLNAIITYNYDDVLERCLEKLDLDIPFKPIHTIGAQPASGQLPIYHVHGYLPRSGAITAEHRITLAEESYHEQYLDVYGWNNMVQINKFREQTCLFIGISLTDPNQRRLLDIAHKQRGDDGHRHFLVRKKETAAGVRARLDALGKELPSAAPAGTQASSEPTKIAERIQENVKAMQPAPETGADPGADIVSSLVELMHEFYEKDAESFGISTIWVDDHEEIPEILGRIRERNAPEG